MYHPHTLLGKAIRSPVYSPIPRRAVVRASYPVVHLHVGIQEGEGGGGNTMPLNVKFEMRLSSSLSILCEHLAILFFLFFFFIVR